jgi:hypothetical protein
MFIRFQGPARKFKGQWVDSRKLEEFFSKTTTRRGMGSPQPPNPRSTVGIRSTGERAGAGAHWPAGQSSQRTGRGTGRAQCQGHKRPIGGVTSREAFSCTCNKHDATIRMHARPVRPHKFCQHNVAITFHIGGIITTLGILLVVSYTYVFEVSVPTKNSITAQFPMMQFTHDSLSQFILHILLYWGQLFIKRRATHRRRCHNLTIGQLIMVTHLLTWA